MEIGDKAPEISVPNEDGQPVSLKSYRGKPVVLFFFPKAIRPVEPSRHAAFAISSRSCNAPARSCWASQRIHPNP
jgi:peroxiredoxin